MTLKPGSFDDFLGSMAAAMEEAFKEEWQNAKSTPLSETGEDDRKILFAAISKGVVRHLKQNAGAAFKIAVQTTQTNAVLMESDNPAGISVSGGGTVAAGAADVRQKNTGANMVVTVGQGTITEVLTDE